MTSPDTSYAGERLTVSVPNDALAADLAAILDDVDLLVWDMTGPAPRDAIDIVVPPYMNKGEVFPRLAGVRTRLVQSQSIGYEGIDAILPPGHVYANAASVHETSTAELAIALTLASQRQIPRLLQQQEHGRWHSFYANSLADRRVLLLGYGGVGKAVAARLAPFETIVTPVASRARDEDGVQVHSVDELADLLPDAEIVILTLPGGDATRHIIDDAALTALPDGALVVNVGRGPLVDTDALTDHVRRGRIRAALDVTEPEPLPADHPLWRLEGALISPHVGGATSAMAPRMVRLIKVQAERMRSGAAPLNVVLPA